nr:reverse transcriptase domain, reverse transcriptase zinc-binding domain protein [Tanacetum cinerariifolium]
MGFGNKWITWVDTCLRSASMSILVNGSPSEEFGLERGVRQGDPLLPFLFILAAEGLNAIVSEAVEKGIFRGVVVGDNNVMVPHLQYTDDMIFFGDWDKDNAKSLMYDGDEEMGCGIGDFLVSNLGLPIRENMRLVKAWGPVVDKFKRRLANLKAKTMSFGGRLTLGQMEVVAWRRREFRGLRLIKNGGGKDSSCGYESAGIALICGGSLWDRMIKSIHGISGGIREGGLGVWGGGGIWRDILKIGEKIDGVGVEFTSSCGRFWGMGGISYFGWIGGLMIEDFVIGFLGYIT